MTSLPTVSVVMSVFNGGPQLHRTLDSILEQADCDFEFIVINDGSTDDTSALLDHYRNEHSRLRVFHQNNSGLTNALIRGCAEARGKYIARQDAGDISYQGRLSKQINFLDKHPEVVMTACAVQFSGPLGEPLRVVSKPLQVLHEGIRQSEVDLISGPQHGATMFRKTTYLEVGGYRQPFVVAQDIDLWIRMSEKGQCFGMEDVLYSASIEPGSISSRRRDEQVRLGSLAIACAELRRAGKAELPLLQAYVPGQAKSGSVSRTEKARFHYFIASSLRESDRDAAKRYYRQALMENPLHVKALLRLMMS